MQFGADAEVYMSNVYLENIIATGGGGSLTLPISFSGADAGGNAGWVITVSDTEARYWVGGAGDWNDASHWSSVSGGAGGACIPTVTNDVYFDVNSGFGVAPAARTITVNNGNAYFRNMNWTGAINNPILNRNAAWNMEGWGDSLILNAAVTLNAIIQLRGPESTTLTGQTLGNFDLELRKSGSSVTLANDFNNNQTDIYLYEGSLIASGRLLNVNSIDNESRDNNLSVDISGSTINARNFWRYSGTTTNRSLDATNAIIITPQFIAQGFNYYQVNISGTAETSARLTDISANKVTFTQTNVIAAIGINGASNQIDTVEFKGGGAIYGTGNTIGTLIFFPGSRYVFTAGTNTTITDGWFGSGTPCQLTEIVSSSSSANATVTMAAGAADFDYVRLQRMTATGGAEFATGVHSINLGNNSGWNIAPYDGAAPITGLGDDLELDASEFPYILTTNGFFGAPQSSYLWNDNSTGNQLTITAPGTYSVSVTFPDGCSVSDEIVVSLAVTLPVTLSQFTAQAKDCAALLKWDVAEAVNFSHFTIQRSKDGKIYEDIAVITYDNAKAAYNYTDASAVNGTNFYRLQLTDIDGKYAFSNVASAYNNCAASEIKVFPTVTSSKVQVQLPSGYEKASVFLLNGQGQRLNGVIKGNGLNREVTLDQLSSGYYLIQVITSREVKTFKIMKQ